MIAKHFPELPMCQASSWTGHGAEWVHTHVPLYAGDTHTRFALWKQRDWAACLVVPSCLPSCLLCEAFHQSRVIPNLSFSYHHSANPMLGNMWIFSAEPRLLPRSGEQGWGQRASADRLGMQHLPEVRKAKLVLSTLDTPRETETLVRAEETHPGDQTLKYNVHRQPRTHRSMMELGGWKRGECVPADTHTLTHRVSEREKQCEQSKQIKTLKIV